MSALRPEDALADYVGALLAADPRGPGVTDAPAGEDPGADFRDSECSGSEHSGASMAPLRQDLPEADPGDTEEDSTADRIALWILSDGAVKLAVACEDVSRFVNANAVAAAGGSGVAELDGVLHRVVDPPALLGQVTEAPERYAV
jgi:hypothetical protein